MKKITIFGMLGTLLLLTFGAVAYAQDNYSQNYSYGYGNMQKMHESMLSGNVSIEEMDAMHDTMTQNINPQLKAQMDAMHDAHINAIKNGNIPTGGCGMINRNQRGVGMMNRFNNQ